jgi:hypothetical protein
MAAGVDLGLQRRQRAGARGGHQGAGLAQPRLQGAEPGGVGGSFREQAHALARGLLVGLDVGGVQRLGGEDQPVEEAPPLRRAFQEQAVLRRRQPDLAQMLGQPPGRDGLAFEADHAAARPGLLHARAQPCRHAGRLHLRRDRPGAAHGLARKTAAHLAQARAAQAAPGDQEADRLEQVRLAGPVRPCEPDAAPVEADVRLPV